MHPPRPASSLARCVSLLLILVVIGVVALDYAHSTAIQPARALRTMEPLTTTDDGGSVAPFCGFAPCGMPLECPP